MEYYDFVSTLIRMLKIIINEMNFHIQNIYDISILITEMVRDSVRSVSSLLSVCHTSLQKNVNGGVEPWSLVTKGKTLVTIGNDLGDRRESLGE